MKSAKSCFHNRMCGRSLWEGRSVGWGFSYTCLNKNTSTAFSSWNFQLFWKSGFFKAHGALWFNRFICEYWLNAWRKDIYFKDVTHINIKKILYELQMLGLKISWRKFHSWPVSETYSDVTSPQPDYGLPVINHWCGNKGNV